MTALLLVEKYSLSDNLITRYPVNYKNTGKVANIPENIEINVETLLEFLLIYSANDAAYISALAVSDNLEDFILLMNSKAKNIGMNDTNFSNPDGMDDQNHYTTLNDLLKLTIYISESLEIVTIASKQKFISDSTGKEKTYVSTNLLIDEGYLGFKTGWTDKAGLTFIGFNQNNDREIITIVNKSIVDDNKYSHFSDTKMLYKISLDTYKNFNIIEKDQYIYTIRFNKIASSYKSNEDWIEFLDITNNSEIKFTKYTDSHLNYVFNNIDRKYKIIESKNSIKWKFNPFKLFSTIANQY